MPFNVKTGSTIEITVEFFDSGILTVPLSATLTVTYPPWANSLTTTSCSISMTKVGNVFIAPWRSDVAALGNSSFSITAPGQNTPTTGTLRIIS